MTQAASQAIPFAETCYETAIEVQRDFLIALLTAAAAEIDKARYQGKLSVRLDVSTWTEPVIEMAAREIAKKGHTVTRQGGFLTISW